MSNGLTTTFALDVQGLPEVIYTSPSTGSGQVGNAYLHLPGVIVAESADGETRYLLSDGLGSIRQAVDESGAVVAYNEYDPYGNSVENDSVPYGFTGEWWEDEVGLLYLRARWYAPETGVFLSVDSVEGEPPYQYVGGDVVNLTDPSGNDPCTDDDPTTICHTPPTGPGAPTIPSQLPLATGSGCNCNFTAGGYAEGVSDTISFAFRTGVEAGREIVYDFATMERATFTYETMRLFHGSDDDPKALYGVGTGLLEKVKAFYFLSLHHFDSNWHLQDEYRDRFEGYTIGVNTPVVEIGAGWMLVWSHGGHNGVTGELQVSGMGPYYAFGLGMDLPLVVSSGVMATNYTPSSDYEDYGNTIQDMQRMRDDIRSGKYEDPAPLSWPVFGEIFGILATPERDKAAAKLEQDYLYTPERCNK